MTRAQKLGITEFPYYEYDSNGKVTYQEDISGYWVKHEYDSKSFITYWESSGGDLWGTKRSTK